MKDEIKIGTKVRTADPLTACATYREESRAIRRAGAIGTVVESITARLFGHEMVRHEDGTEAPYDASELTPVEVDAPAEGHLPSCATQARCNCGAPPEPTTRQAVNRLRWAALGLNGGAWIEDATDRENHLLQQVARLREVEAVKLPAIEAVLDKHRAAFGVTLPQAPARPGHLICPMCTGKGQVPERVAWGPENGGDPPPWHRPLTDAQARRRAG